MKWGRRPLRQFDLNSLRAARANLGDLSEASLCRAVEDRSQPALVDRCSRRVRRTGVPAADYMVSADHRVNEELEDGATASHIMPVVEAQAAEWFLPVHMRIGSIADVALVAKVRR